MTDTLFGEPPADPAGTTPAIRKGHRAASSAVMSADERWAYHATWTIKTMVPGTTFLAEDVAFACQRGGFATSDARALGHVIRQAQADGWIEATGDYRRAKSSHGQPKPVWRRVVA